MPSLLNLPALRTEHGPPLSMDIELRWVLKQKIFHAFPFLYHRNTHFLHRM